MTSWGAHLVFLVGPKLERGTPTSSSGILLLSKSYKSWLFWGRWSYLASGIIITQWCYFYKSDIVQAGALGWDLQAYSESSVFYMWPCLGIQSFRASVALAGNR